MRAFEGPIDRAEPSAVWFDPATGILRSPAGESRLTPKAAAVLEILVERPGRVVSKEELLGSVWPDTAVCDEVLTTVVYELRQALGESARDPRYVETLRKRGYRWIAAPPRSEEVPLPATAEWSRRARFASAASIAVVLVASLLAGVHQPAGPVAGSSSAAASEPSALVCDLLLRGVRVASEGTPEAVRRAIGHLERAAALEPGWAPVHLALAESHLELGSPPAVERARQALERAAALGADPGEIHLLRAALWLRVDRDPEEALVQLGAAQEGSSCGGPRIDVRRAETLSALGRSDEAIELLRGLAESGPGTGVEALRELGRALALDGQLQAAEETLVQAVELAPYHVPTLRHLAAVRTRLGDAEGSWEVTRREAYALRIPPAALVTLEHAWQRGGLEGVQRWRLAHAETLALDAVQRAAAWAALGELERAAEELRAAENQGRAGLVWVAVDPIFAPLRAQERYRELIDELTRPELLNRS